MESKRMDYYYYEFETSTDNANEAKKEVKRTLEVKDAQLYFIKQKEKPNLVKICAAAESRDHFVNKIKKTDSFNLSSLKVKKSILCDIEDPRIKKYRVVDFRESDESRRFKKILFLGKHITEESIEAGFFYLGVKNNPFWLLLSRIYDSEVFAKQESADLLFQECQRLHIGLADVIGSCYCLGSDDSQIINGSEEKNEHLQKLLNEAELVVYNGKSGYERYKKRFEYSFSKTPEIFVPSSSGACAMSFEDKLKEWNTQILKGAKGSIRK